ncbi:MAG: Fe-S cluster assembly ATPase SufC [Flavobacteriales bacterium]|nr:Fe-S cluster assembly ATPase SufC [Flavobacteriales bacterium]|tara:strand:+ start:28970 stop:29707 length:738 start_codon:yes stop_codon:yes gene_type:complete
MLKIENLHCEIEGNSILKGINLSIGSGETHAIMGPNGSGKSTLSSVIAGDESYEITSGSIQFLGKDLLDFSAEERAHLGVFLSFQYPIEIPGVSVSNFLKTALNECRKANDLPPLSARDMLALMKSNLELLQMNSDFLSRSMNAGFSGGEKKRNEIFQLAMLEPKICVLDETDSGLDIDALKVVANGVNKLRNNSRSFLIITHYQRLLDHISPDHVHVLVGGKIIKSGGPELALELEKNGYDKLC